MAAVQSMSEISAGNEVYTSDKSLNHFYMPTNFDPCSCLCPPSRVLQTCWLCNNRVAMPLLTGLPGLLGPTKEIATVN